MGHNHWAWTRETGNCNWAHRLQPLKPMFYSYWSPRPRACALWQHKPPAVRTHCNWRGLRSLQPEKSPCSSEGPMQPRINKIIKKNRLAQNDRIDRTIRIPLVRLHPIFKSFLPHWKRPWCWEGLGAGGEGDDRGWDGWMASPTRWTWVWVTSGSWWWTGRPGVLRFMGSQRVGHDWATELTDHISDLFLILLVTQNTLH